MTVFSVDLGAKRLELLRDLVPSAKIIAMLVNPTGQTAEQDVVQAAADKFGQQVRMLKVSTDRDLDAAFATMVEERVGALAVHRHSRWWLFPEPGDALHSGHAAAPRLDRALDPFDLGDHGADLRVVAIG
jgi:hypothetical protein